MSEREDVAAAIGEVAALVRQLVDRLDAVTALLDEGSAHR